MAGCAVIGATGFGAGGAAGDGFGSFFGADVWIGVGEGGRAVGCGLTANESRFFLKLGTVFLT